MQPIQFLQMVCQCHLLLLEACKAVDADIEKSGEVSADTVELVRSAITACEIDK